jgi:hypothetical protein
LGHIDTIGWTSILTLTEGTPTLLTAIAGSAKPSAAIPKIPAVICLNMLNSRCTQHRTSAVRWDSPIAL